MKRGSLSRTVGRSLSSEYGGSLRFPQLGSSSLLDLEGVSRFLGGGSLGPGCGGGDPRSPRLRGLGESRPPAELGGSPSAAGGLRCRRYEQPGPAVPDPGLVRALAAAPASDPPGTRAPAPAPARAALHRCIAAPPSGPRAPARLARGSALRLARHRPPLCPPCLARAFAHAHSPRRALSLPPRPPAARRGAQILPAQRELRGAPTPPSGRAGS